MSTSQMTFVHRVLWPNGQVEYFMTYTQEDSKEKHRFLLFKLEGEGVVSTYELNKEQLKELNRAFIERREPTLPTPIRVSGGY